VELQELGSVKLPIKMPNIQPGQRFLVEVIEKDPSGKAQIRLGGQIIPALLEVAAQPGEKFWARVQRIDENGIVLTREKFISLENLNPQGIERLYIEFGQNKEQSLASLLKLALGLNKDVQLPSEGKDNQVTNESKGTPVHGEGKGIPVTGDGKSAPAAGDGKSPPVTGDNKSASLPGDSKGTQVVSDSESAPATNDGKGTPATSEGKGAPAAGEGKNIPVPGDGKSAPVPSDGKSPQVPGDGKGDPVASEPKTAPVAGESRGVSVTGEGKGTPVTGESSNAPVVNDGKGTAGTGDGKSAPVAGHGKNVPVPGDNQSPKSAPSINEGTGTQVTGDAKGATVVSAGEMQKANGTNEAKGTLPLAEEKALPGKEGVRVQTEGALDTSEEKVLTGREQIAQFVNQYVPQWSSLNKDSFMQLFLLLRGLGLDYEHRLKKLDSSKREQIENLRGELKNTLKGILLSLLASGTKGEEKSQFTNLLERLTGQQILMQGGNSETPFYLMEIPLQADGEIYSQTLAIKASRRGNKLDLDHCRLALRAETPTLGELGIEGWMYESQLSLRVYGNDPEYIQSLIEDNYDHTREIFSNLGITLHPIAVGPLQTAEEFKRFLKGEMREGVDYQV